MPLIWKNIFFFFFLFEKLWTNKIGTSPAQKFAYVTVNWNLRAKFQNFLKNQKRKTMTEKLGFCLILTLNKIKTSWSLKKPSAVSKWGRWWMKWSWRTWEKKKSEVFLREGKRGSTRERERERERKRGREDMNLRERITCFSFFFFFFFGFYILT